MIQVAGKNQTTDCMEGFAMILVIIILIPFAVIAELLKMTK